ncbi:MAG TPA: hypothetical protein VGE12_11245 [Noviherbaspirillum sp.]
MQIETIGKYQLHLIAHEVADSGRWDPFITILKFDDEQQDFTCVVPKRRAADHVFTDYQAAIDAARRVGTELIQSGTL